MDKLNKANQEWLRLNSEYPCSDNNGAMTTAYIDADFVEAKLLEMQTEIERLKDELRDLLPEFNCPDAMTDKHLCSRAKSCGRCSTKLSIMNTLGVTPK